MSNVDRRFYASRRIEVVEVGDVRQPRNGDAEGSVANPWRAVVEGEGILLRQAQRGGEMGDDAEARQAGARGDDAEPAGEQAHVTAEPVDQVPSQQRALVVRQQLPGAHQVGDDAAPVDVRHQHHRDLRGGGKAHVGDVMGTQVDLGGAARAFHQDEVRRGPQPLEALQDHGHQLLLRFLEVSRVVVAAHLAADHHLSAHVGLRLEQHRVHVHRGRDPAGPGLQRLGSSDLAAVGRYRGVVGHVLRLERPHRVAAAGEQAAKPGGHQRLAGVRGRSLEHEGAGRHQSGGWPLRVRGIPADMK